MERINTRFGVGTAKPIHYRYAQLEPAELVAYYRMADVAMVTSLHDGMNLVAKEFVASQVEHIQGASDRAALAAVEAPGVGIPVLEDL